MPVLPPPTYVAQAGTIPFRVHPARGLQFLLITNSRRTQWVFPKGHIERDRSAIEQAVQETWEEAGVLGTILTPGAGEYEYAKLGRLYRVEVFLMHVTEQLAEWPELGLRDRQWVSARDVMRLHQRPEAADVLTRSLARLRRLHEGGMIEAAG